MTFEDWYESLSWRADASTVLDMRIAWDAGRAEGYAAAKEQAAEVVKSKQFKTKLHPPFYGERRVNEEGTFANIEAAIRAMEEE